MGEGLDRSRSMDKRRCVREGFGVKALLNVGVCDVIVDVIAVEARMERPCNWFLPAREGELSCSEDNEEDIPMRSLDPSIGVREIPPCLFVRRAGETAANDFPSCWVWRRLVGR